MKKNLLIIMIFCSLAALFGQEVQQEDTSFTHRRRHGELLSTEELMRESDFIFEGIFVNERCRTYDLKGQLNIDDFYSYAKIRVIFVYKGNIKQGDTLEIVRKGGGLWYVDEYGYSGYIESPCSSEAPVPSSTKSTAIFFCVHSEYPENPHKTHNYIAVEFTQNRGGQCVMLGSISFEHPNEIYGFGRQFLSRDEVHAFFNQFRQYGVYAPGPTGHSRSFRDLYKTQAERDSFWNVMEQRRQQAKKNAEKLKQQFQKCLPINKAHNLHIDIRNQQVIQDEDTCFLVFDVFGKANTQ